MGDKKNISIFVISFMLIFIMVFSVSPASAKLSGLWNKITGRVTSQSVNLNITVANTAPQIVNVTVIPAQSITENSFVNIAVNFTAYDADGFANLQVSGGRGNLTRAGEATRYNTTCNQISTYATSFANYSCTIHLWYYDQAGQWNVSVGVNDSSNAFAQNITTNFSLGSTSAFVIAPTSLTWASVSSGATNQTSNNDPLLLNNTGNADVTTGNLQMNATDLDGETDSAVSLYARNFTIGNNTGSSAECDFSTATYNATAMSRGIFTALNLTNLSRGNYSLNDGRTAVEQIYFCLRLAGTELSSQAYSTTNEGAWTIKIA